MSEKYYQSIGRRKTAIAQVRLFPAGSGKFTINGLKLEEYLDTPQHRDIAVSPLKEVGKSDGMDITVRVIGGGKSGQADAIKLGVARALVKYDETFKATIKAHNMLTRDSRKKERKKFGLRGARRATQWRKR